MHGLANVPAGPAVSNRGCRVAVTDPPVAAAGPHELRAPFGSRLDIQQCDRSAAAWDEGQASAACNRRPPRSCIREKQRSRSRYRVHASERRRSLPSCRRLRLCFSSMPSGLRSWSVAPRLVPPSGRGRRLLEHNHLPYLRHTTFSSGAGRSWGTGLTYTARRHAILPPENFVARSAHLSEAQSAGTVVPPHRDSKSECDGERLPGTLTARSNRMRLRLPVGWKAWSFRSTSRAALDRWRGARAAVWARWADAAGWAARLQHLHRVGRCRRVAAPRPLAVADLPVAGAAGPGRRPRQGHTVYGRVRRVHCPRPCGHVRPCLDAAHGEQQCPHRSLASDLAVATFPSTSARPCLR